VPFTSKRQARLCYAKDRGEAGSWDCHEFSADTDFSKIPEKVKEAAIGSAVGRGLRGAGRYLGDLARRHPVAAGVAGATVPPAVAGLATYGLLRRSPSESKGLTPPPSTAGWGAAGTGAAVGGLGLLGLLAYKAYKEREDRRNRYKSGSDQMNRIQVMAKAAAYRAAMEEMTETEKRAFLGALARGVGGAAKAFGRGMKGAPAAQRLGGSMRLTPTLAQRGAHAAGAGVRNLGQMAGGVGGMLGRNWPKIGLGAGTAGGLGWLAKLLARPATQLTGAAGAPMRDPTIEAHRAQQMPQGAVGWSKEIIDSLRRAGAMRQAHRAQQMPQAQGAGR